jgi:hypothetical protein
VARSMEIALAGTSPQRSKYSRPESNGISGAETATVTGGPWRFEPGDGLAEL